MFNRITTAQAQFLARLLRCRLDEIDTNMSRSEASRMIDAAKVRPLDTRRTLLSEETGYPPTVPTRKRSD